MPNLVKNSFLDALRQKTGALLKLGNSNSLYDVAGGAARIYIRYSKVHARGAAFYGLRKEDIRQLEGHPSFIVFLWDGQAEPLFVPFAAYEDVFHSTEPAPDGQYKAQIFLNSDSIELYLARLGRFNLEGLSGWERIGAILNTTAAATPVLSHSQVQSILSAIGTAKGYEIWIPPNDRGRLHTELSGSPLLRDELPSTLKQIGDILQEVDVLWLRRGSNELCGLFEVEHTTPIYSALLRFNDVHLAASNASQIFRIIADDSRRGLFVRQLGRPTFRASGLDQICTFLEYRNVYGWFTRVCNQYIPIGASQDPKRVHEISASGTATS